MAELDRCLGDGYTTTGTLGTGLGAVQRITDTFLIRSRAGEGTLASARLTHAPRLPAPAGRA